MSIPGIQELRKENDRKRLSRRLKRLGIAAAVLAVLYSVVGFFVLPGIVQKRLGREAGAVLGREVTVERVRINPWTLSVRVQGLKVVGREFDKLLSWDELLVNFDLASVVHREFRFQEVRLSGLSLNVGIDPNGRLNFADIIERLRSPAAQPDSKPAESAKALWPFRIASLSFSTHKLYYIDRTRTPAFEDTIEGANFSVMNLTNATGEASAGGLQAEVAPGETLTWRGKLALQPLASNGRIEARGISLGKLFAHVANRFPFAVRAGKLSADVEYDVAVGAGGFQGKVGQARVEITGLGVADAGADKNKVSLESLVVDGVKADTEKRTVDVGSVVLSGAKASVVRDAKGLDLARWAPAPAKGQPAATPAPETGAPAWTLSLGKAVVTGAGIEFLDTTTPRQAVLAVQSLDLSAGPLSTAKLGEPVPFTANAALRGGGVISTEGSVSAQPLQARAKVAVTALPLAPFTPFIGAIVPLEVQRGAFRLEGEVSFADEGGVPALGASLDAAVTGLAVRREGSEDPLLDLAELAVHRMEFTSAPSPRLVVGELSLSRPAITVVRGASGELNVAMTPKLPTPSAEGATSVSAATGALKPSVAVDRVLLSDAEFVFVDRSVSPSVRVGLSNFGGSVTGLSSESFARAGVDLQGKLEGAADVRLKGQVNPLADEAFTDLAFTLKGFDLQPLSPYLGKYVGHVLGQGVAGIDVQVKLNKRKLDSRNLVTFAPLTLGAATESPDAVKAPVGLALALLRDRSGKIELDVPVAGSLDDPEFRISKVVWRIVGNLLTKAATSPFALIGSMFGGGGEELGYQDFGAGLAALDADAVRKVGVVAKALRERPSLAVDIAPAWDVVADTGALRAAQLQRRLLALANEEMRATAPAGAVVAEATELSPDAEMRLLGRLAGQLGVVATSGAVSPAATAPAEAPATVSEQQAAQSTDSSRKSVWRRVVDFFREPAEPETRRAAVTAPRKAPSRTVAPTSAGALAGSPTPTTPSLDPALLRSRVLEALAVSDDDLRQLAAARGNAIRNALVADGVEPERVVLLPVRAASTRVTLTLR
ncbi:DUF748 domain-containing protein [Nibricoccus sp. IMCC34717]|uniref:DUF748 domain-containing protein n=1 Tax=Nibricoccus sp. IMCC34717 TaxID=3034021 RepID=UPI00385115DA